jgi:cytidylate kinase
VPILAMTKEMGSLGTFIGLEVARRLGYEFLRNDIIKEAAREYRVLESRLVGTVEQAPRFLERFQVRSRRHRAYLEAAVLEAALRERVVLMGRWSTIFLRGVRHAIRIRVCAPPDVRAQRIMARLGLDHAQAMARITTYDEGVRTRMRQLFTVDWTDPLLYDLVINTEAVTLETGVKHVLDLAAAPEFQPSEESRAALWNRAVAARVRATLKANRATTGLDLDVRASDGQVVLAGVVGSEAEREAALTVTRGVRGVVGVVDDVKVFRRPVR